MGHFCEAFKHALTLINFVKQSLKKLITFAVVDSDQWLAPLPDGQKYKCLMCAKEFTQRGNAKSHFKQFHSGIQQEAAVCHVCGKRFSRGKRNRNEHLRVVHGITQAMMRRMNTSSESGLNPNDLPLLDASMKFDNSEI